MSTEPREKGAFVLFGLFERTDMPNRWDVVVSATWLDSNSIENYSYIADKITAKLTSEEISNVTRIVALNPSDGFVQDVLDKLNHIHGKQGGVKEIAGTFFGVEIKNAYVITSLDVTSTQDSYKGKKIA